MATLYTLPANSDSAHYQFSVDLAGTTYFFNIDWNDRAETWYMDILDSEKNDILTGVALVLGIDFLALSSNSAKPAGQMYLYNFASEFVEAARDTLGTDVQLLYYGVL